MLKKRIAQDGDGAGHGGRAVKRWETAEEVAKKRGGCGLGKCIGLCGRAVFFPVQTQK